MALNIISLMLAAISGIYGFDFQPGSSQDRPAGDSSLIRLITLDPGHFHAALVQKSMYPGIDPQVFVYAPEGAELQSHLNLVNGYNTRMESPTHWQENVYTGPDFLEKMISEKKGNVVVMAGNNRRKTEYITRSINAGMNVLGDKPMAIDTANFHQLVQAFQQASKRGVLLYDIMTERSEITNTLQRALIHMPALFGEFRKGTADSPAVVMESVHHFYKNVSGAALTRPAWFFDASQQGNAIVDVGTHLADLVQWECFPEQAIHYNTDIRINSAKRWPAPLSLSQFRLITKLDAFPGFLAKYVSKDTILDTDANGMVSYSIKGLQVKITALWRYAAPGNSGDTHYSLMRGTKADILIRQGQEEAYQPTVYIRPAKNNSADFSPIVDQSIKSLQAKYPGVAAEKTAEGWKLIIPEKYKVGHEAHFGQVMERYLDYLRKRSLPDWEVPGIISKYYVTTYGSAMSER